MYDILTHKNKKHCNNCKHKLVIADGFNTPFIECTGNVNHKTFSQYEGQYFKLPQKCGSYKPVIVDYCINCGQEINTPEYDHPIWAINAFDQVPCCSDKCLKEQQKKMDQKFQNKE